LDGSVARGEVGSKHVESGAVEVGGKMEHFGGVIMGWSAVFVLVVVVWTCDIRLFERGVVSR
jgi:hypothetical protein